MDLNETKHKRKSKAHMLHSHSLYGDILDFRLRVVNIKLAYSASWPNFEWQNVKGDF